jgi:5-formyltetrahydrofolate cyclo-ligase
VPNSDIDGAKQTARESVWALLERNGAAPPGVHGHIPDFAGAEEAAARLGALDVWRRARVVKANPDRAQLPARRRALRDGKLLYMAVPRLATLEPFHVLDPATLSMPSEETASPRVGLADMRPVDLVVCGSVAVNRRGVRVGKGAGYSDIEVALLTEAGLVGPATTIVTTVHELQVVEGELPETEHDFSVDVIITPTESIMCGPARRPAGILVEQLSAAVAGAIPVLRSRGGSSPHDRLDK